MERLRQPGAIFSSVVALLLIIASAPRAFAGGRIEDRDGKTIIHIVCCPEGCPNPAWTDPGSRAGVAAVREFKKQFPRIFAERYRDKYKVDPAKYGKHNWDNVEVEVEPFSSIYVEGVETDLLAIAGEMAPDILYVNFRKSDNYIEEKFLYPLDKPEDGYLSAMPKDEVDARIVPKLWPVIQRKGPDGQKHVWAFPYGGAIGKVLLFRKDLFDEKHIPYPTANWTWADMLDASRKITDPDHGKYALVFATGKQESWNWVTFLWSAGGEAMTYNNATDRWSCTFDSPEAAVALDYYVKLNSEKWTDAKGEIHRGYADRDPEGYAKWDRGEIAMNFGYIIGNVFSTINPEVTGMAPVPFGPTGKRGGELNSTMLGLFSQIKEVAVRDAAWEYIRFYECPPAMGIKTKMMVEGGLGRFIQPKLLRAYGYPEIERLSPPGWAENFQIAIDTGKPEPYGRNSNIAYNMMTYPIQEAMELAYNDKLPTDENQRLDVMRQLLIKANSRANEEMIGIIPPGERTKRRVYAIVLLVALVATFAYVFHKIIKTFAPPAALGIEQKRWAFRRHAWAYALLIPSLATILIWQYLPLARGSAMAFQDFHLLAGSHWVGLDNFGDLIVNSPWWQSVWNSVRYSALVIGMTFLPPIVLAILLQEIPQAKLLLRTVYYLPAVITGLVTVLLWKMFYEPSKNGALNLIVLNIPAIGFIAFGVALFVFALLFAKRMAYHEMFWAAVIALIVGVILMITCSGLSYDILFPRSETWAQCFSHLFSRLFAFHTEAFRWREDPNTAMVACVIPMVWAGVGPGSLIYLAALKGIPDDYFEAADIDGATFIDKVILVVFPILKPLIIINFVGVFIGSFYGAAGNILAMTGGGANTEVADLALWYKAFTFLKFGPATAMAWMLGFLLIGFTVYQLRILSRVEFRAAGAGAAGKK